VEWGMQKNLKANEIIFRCAAPLHSLVLNILQRFSPRCGFAVGAAHRSICSYL